MDCQTKLFTNLPQKEQDRIVDKIISFITNPRTVYYPSNDHNSDWLCLERIDKRNKTGLGFISKHFPIYEDHIQEKYFGCRQFSYYAIDYFNRGYTFIVFKELPEKVALLLAVIFWPAFECYKKTLEK